MKAFTKGLAGALLGIVAVLGIVAALGSTVFEDSPVMQAAREATGGVGTAAANAALDASGVKEQIESTLRSNASAIAAATGMSQSQVEAAIDNLDISSWRITTLPDDATVRGSFNTTYNGADATVTTYADPSYVTVDALGQTLTLEVPSSAQDYVSLLSYL